MRHHAYHSYVVTRARLQICLYQLAQRSLLEIDLLLLRFGFCTLCSRVKCAIFYFFGRKPKICNLALPERREALFPLLLWENYSKLSRFFLSRCIYYLNLGVIFVSNDSIYEDETYTRTL